eukprot:gene11167-biopygen1709
MEATWWSLGGYQFVEAPWSLGGCQFVEAPWLAGLMFAQSSVVGGVSPLTHTRIAPRSGDAAHSGAPSHD